MGVHSLEKLGAKMGANSFYYQRARAERNSKNLGALNTLPTYMYYLSAILSTFVAIATVLFQFYGKGCQRLNRNRTDKNLQEISHWHKFDL